MAALVLLGGLSALLGAMIMLTQSAVKTALAWSTVAQMGFLLLQCGWACGRWRCCMSWPIRCTRPMPSWRRTGGPGGGRGPAARPGRGARAGAVARAFGMALVLYAVVALVFWAIGGTKSAQALALGAILIFGTAYLVAQGLADAAPRALTQRTAVASLATATGYFGFHLLADRLWGSSLPLPPSPARGMALIALVLVSFGLIAVAQALFPLWMHHPATAALRVHLATGCTSTPSSTG